MAPSVNFTDRHKYEQMRLDFEAKLNESIKRVSKTSPTAAKIPQIKAAIVAPYNNTQTGGISN